MRTSFLKRLLENKAAVKHSDVKYVRKFCQKGLPEQRKQKDAIALIKGDRIFYKFFNKFLTGQPKAGQTEAVKRRKSLIRFSLRASFCLSSTLLQRV